MRSLLGVPAYQQHWPRAALQTVLIGYSEAIATAASALRVWRRTGRSVPLTVALNSAQGHVLFHSRGGSIRAAAPGSMSCCAPPPAESVSGVLRFTEQGESVAQNFGLRANAMRSLERAFNTLALATLAVRRGVAVQESVAFAAGVAQVAAQSRIAWRALLDRPGFYEFFRAVTPIDVIERMRIGAQQRREPVAAASVAAVPAAAWVYAWSQSRHMLPGWYGAGSGLEAARAQRGPEILRRAYRGWPFFRNLIDDIEAMLARADMEIASRYDELAATDGAVFAADIRAEYALTCRLVGEIKENAALLDGDRTLQRSIALRNPYVDPMNLMQVDLLRRWRAAGREVPPCTRRCWPA
jgi:phosphoenolpyruvate carboxylase